MNMKKLRIAIGLLTLMLTAAPVAYGDSEDRVVELLEAHGIDVTDASNSSCSSVITAFTNEIITDTSLYAAVSLALNGIKDPPENYGPYQGINPWRGTDVGEFAQALSTVFGTWCEWLPEISGSHDNGLFYIQFFAMFYYQNPAAVDLVQGRNPSNPSQPMTQFFDFLREFSDVRGEFMNTAASTTYIAQWISDPRVEIEDYTKTNPSDYASWNEFFIRELRRQNPNDPSSDIVARPVTMSQYPDRDYIIVAPTDCIMNALEQAVEYDPALGVTAKQYIENPIDFNTVINVKEYPISVDALLGNTPSDIKNTFVGGTGLTCVLMPNTYHHFHSPVNGAVVHAEVIPAGTYGYEDFPNWASADGSVGRSGTDFTQFQSFQRGVIIVRVSYKDYNGRELTGYVASIPVGLNTIGSVVLDDYIVGATVSDPVPVKAGNSRFGHFLYGGSLDILLFSKDLVQSSAIQTRLGNQIGLIDTMKSPF